MQLLVHSHEFNEIMARLDKMEVSTQQAYAAIGARLGRLESDVLSLKIQGDRNEIAVQTMRADIQTVRTDVKWLKRSSGWEGK